MKADTLFVRLLAISMLAALLLVAAYGCMKTMDTPYDEIKDTLLKEEMANITDANSTEKSALVCRINNLDYYMFGPFIYHMNSKGDRILFSVVGTYTKDNGRDVWTLRMYNSRNDSIYTDTMEWISSLELPNGEAISCTETTTIPASLADFYIKHIMFFDKSAVEKDRATETTSAAASV